MIKDRSATKKNIFFSSSSSLEQLEQLDQLNPREQLEQLDQLEQLEHPVSQRSKITALVCLSTRYAQPAFIKFLYYIGVTVRKKIITNNYFFPDRVRHHTNQRMGTQTVIFFS